MRRERIPSFVLAPLYPIVLLVTISPLTPNTVNAEPLVYVCHLQASQETAAVVSDATGIGTFSIDTEANTVTYEIAYGGLTSARTAAHIHGFSAPGVNSSPVHNLPDGNPIAGVWNYDEGQEAQILTGLTYVNIHTTNYGGGEIRGQVIKPIDLHAVLLPEAGVEDSEAKGEAWLQLDPVADILSYRIEFTGLETDELAAHIHGFAPRSGGAPPVHTLALGSPKIGLWNYGPSQEAMILDDLSYINVHSQDHPGGEIRGQIVRPPVKPGWLHYIATLEPGQEGHEVVSDASGRAEMAIDTENNTLCYEITFQDLTSDQTAAHFHGFGPPGENRPPVLGLPLGSPQTGVWKYTDEQEADILAGYAYINVHTQDYAGGEIRGQVVPAIELIATLESEQESPANSETGGGTGRFIVDTVANRMRYLIEYGGLSSGETGAHIHGFAAPGYNAGVIHPLPATNPKEGVWAYSEDQEAKILTGLTYVNVHTSNHPGGEIRGQIVQPALLAAHLNAGNETHEVESDGTGTARFLLDPVGHTLHYHVSHGGLTSMEIAAHIHGFSGEGVNSAAIFPLALESPKTGVWHYDPANEADILKGLTYVNVHTGNYPGGEIRGQILPLDRDNDGVWNRVEIDRPSANTDFLSNAYLPDSDGDGLPDGVENLARDLELRPGDTTPTDPDTDGDGVEDGIEVLVAGWDPLDDGDPAVSPDDLDSDLLPDGFDPDAGLPDTDGDRYLDGYEAAVIQLAAADDADAVPVLGDVFVNDNRDNGDSQVILNLFAGQTTLRTDFRRADVNRDGFIDNGDAQQALNFFGNALPTYPAH